MRTFIALAATATTALAQEPPPPYDESQIGSAAPGLTLDAGTLLIAGQTININLSSERVGEPISAAPALWYGIDDKLTIGLTHDGGATWWTPRPVPGAGICVTGEDGGCGDVYDNVGFDVLYGFTDAKLALAIHGGLYASGFDPLTLSVRAGLLGKFAATGQVSLVFDPALFFGVTERDNNGGNKEQIDLPLWVWFSASSQLGIYGGIALQGPLEEFGDAYRVPVGVGASYMIDSSLTIGGDFWFLDLDETDDRAISLRLAVAL